MKTLKFIVQKIIIVEVMLIILYFAKDLFNVSISIFDLIIDTGIQYLTPISIIALVIYIICCLLSFKIIEIALGFVLGGINLYYLFNH